MMENDDDKTIDLLPRILPRLDEEWARRPSRERSMRRNGHLSRRGRAVLERLANEFGMSHERLRLIASSYAQVKREDLLERRRRGRR